MDKGQGTVFLLLPGSYSEAKYGSKAGKRKSARLSQ
jgi:hypothetical protein